ncbi:hypothetical protein ID866_11171 [Astraeus odoratus]|nr:hypothetical protein ID866_11171 [Astraeus odoratus]
MVVGPLQCTSRVFQQRTSFNEQW